MRKRVSSFFYIIFLGFFVFSLMPLNQQQFNETDNLRAVVLQVQNLQNSSDTNTDFNNVFSDMMTAFSTAAGFQWISIKQIKDTFNDVLQIVVPIRTPYLVATNQQVKKKLFATEILAIIFSFLYQSHISLPETPPPVLV